MLLVYWPHVQVGGVVVRVRHVKARGPTHGGDVTVAVRIRRKLKGYQTNTNVGVIRKIQASVRLLLVEKIDLLVLL